DNKPYVDYDFRLQRSRRPFKPEAPVNTSRNGRTTPYLPPAQPAFWYYPRASACAGPVYYHADYADDPGKLPKALDSCLIVYDWTSAWMRLIKLDANGGIVFNEPWLARHRFIHPSDLAFDRKGHLYLLEYGTPWYDGTDGKLKRITYSEARIPFEVPPDDPRMAGLPEDHPGTRLISASTCLACHTTEQTSIGPPYKEVVRKYAGDGEAVEALAKRIVEGGGGVWGEIPMPPHPQHKLEEARRMVEAILAIR
ncbi:MAG: hypothetical protein GWO24_28410, partial [Akkermansiaceae bacterium]|nr:hypothetical protein [Akkermansiaceae bacterium]